MTGCARSPLLPAGIPVAGETRHEILTSLASRGSAVTSFRALARTRIDARGERHLFRQIFAFERPDRVRVEALPLSGAWSLSLFVARGGKAVFLDPGAKTARTGPVSLEFVEQALGLPLSTGELMALLVGAPTLAGSGAERAEVQEGADGALLVRLSPTFIWELEGGSLRPRRVFLVDPWRERPRAILEFEQYTTVAGLDLPAAVRVELPGQGAVVKLTFSSFTINRPLPGDLFRAEIPAEFTRIESDVGATPAGH